MSAPTLVAVELPPSAAAPAIEQLWDNGEAVLVLNPNAPSHEKEQILQLARPSFLLDQAGRRALADGVPAGEDGAAVIATSGTTGEPKLVELSRSAMRASTRSVSAALGEQSNDVWLCCVPLHNVAGLGILARVWHGSAGLVIHEGFDPAAVASAPEREGATLVSLVPTTLRRMLQAGLAPVGYRRVLLGGAPAAQELLDQATQAGVTLTTTYGLTETWGGLVYDGWPLQDAQVRLEVQGEVLLRGPMLMSGYRNRLDLTREVLDENGWLHTGDIGQYAPGGALQVIDRRSELIISGGVNVSPSEVEQVLARHPKVADVCIAGEADEHWGERVVAYVVTAEGQGLPALEDLRDFARQFLSTAKLPRRIVGIEAVPRSPAGKVLRRLLVARDERGLPTQQSRD